MMRSDDVQYVKSLLNLEIYRINRSIVFVTPDLIQYQTTIDFRPKNTDVPIYVVPVEMYKKNVLVNFETFFMDGTRCVPASSEQNDEIIIKYIFCKLWERIDSDTRDEAKNWLLEAFLGKINQCQDKKIDEILKLPFKGPLYNYIKNAMWKPKEPHLTLKNLINDIEQSSFKLNIFNNKLTQPPEEPSKTISEFGELRELLSSLDKYFLQLVFLPHQNSTKNCYYQLISKINLRVSTKRRHLCGIIPLSEFSSTIDVWLNPFLIDNELPSFHLEIVPPKGLIFKYSSFLTTSLRKIIDKINFKNSNFLTNLLRKAKDEIFSNKYVTFTDINSPGGQCENFLRPVGLKVKQSSVIDQQSGKKSEEDWNNQYVFSNEHILLYFRRSKRDVDPSSTFDEVMPCLKPHNVKVSFKLQNSSIIVYYVLFIVILCSSFILEIKNIGILNSESSLETTNLILGYVLFVVGYGIATVIDYTSRNESQRLQITPLFVFLLFVVLLALVFLIIILLYIVLSA